MKNLGRLKSLAWGLCALAAGTACMAQPASAQDYPSRPIRLVVPFAAGGPTDFVARLVGDKLTTALKQPVIIDVRAGASGTIGTDIVAKAPADGYTLLYGTSTTMTLAPSLDKVPYDPIKDFAPVSALVAIPQLLLVGNTVPANSVKEIIALAKAHPGTLNYGSGGEGSTPFFGMELFKVMAGIEATHVPYKGLAPALTDLMGGQIQLLFHTAQPSLMPMVKSGKFKLVAVSSAQRSPSLPDVPTVAEAGVPGFENVAWHALYAPAGTPPAIVGKLNAEVVRILKDPATAAKLAEQGIVPAPGTPVELAAFMRAEAERANRVVKQIGGKRG